MCLPLGEEALSCLFERRQSLERVLASWRGEALACIFGEEAQSLERVFCVASWRGGLGLHLGEEAQSLERFFLASWRGSLSCLLERRHNLWNVFFTSWRGGTVFGTLFASWRGGLVLPLGEEALSLERGFRLLERRPSLWSMFLPHGQEVCLQKPLGEEARAVGAAPTAPGSRSTRPPRISKPSPS